MLKKFNILFRTVLRTNKNIIYIFKTNIFKTNIKYFLEQY